MTVRTAFPRPGSLTLPADGHLPKNYQLGFDIEVFLDLVKPVPDSEECQAVAINDTRVMACNVWPYWESDDPSKADNQNLYLEVPGAKRHYILSVWDNVVELEICDPTSFAEEERHFIATEEELRHWLQKILADSQA